MFWAFPHAIAGPAPRPDRARAPADQLPATPHTGIPVRKARAKPAGKPKKPARQKPGPTSKAHPDKKPKQKPAAKPITRRTVIRIGMYAWFDDRGDYLAREVRRKWNQGCSVRIVYSVLNSKVKRILYDPSGRGRIPMRRVVRIDELTGEVVDYNHSKYLAMSGTYRHRGHRFVWSGSMNFTGFGLYCDDLVFRLHGKRVVRAYFHNFHRVWRSPKASRPIPTRAFGTLSRLAPVPGAAGLSGRMAGVAPETDELESPRAGRRGAVRVRPGLSRLAGMDAATLAADLHALLVERGETVASAESLTGGGLADLLSSTPGASSSYVGGVVGYATSVKVKVLGVPADLVERYGVVSEECAGAMATGARDVLGATWAVSTTGVAGPTEQEGQPVGTVFVGIAGPGGLTVSELALDGDRDAIRAQTCLLALDQVLAVVGTA